jgi:hypothetical protein
MRLKVHPAAPVLAAVLALAGSAAARADGVLLNCFNPHCPKCKHCFEGPPILKFKPGCPKPCCDPCNLQHYGYYRACWAPWPFPPDWDHCAVIPPGAVVPPHPGREPIPDTPSSGTPTEKTPAPQPKPPLLDMSMARPSGR